MIKVNQHIYWCVSLSLFQNGYPSRRRSLVDDARFESSLVKQTKQAVLDEARLKANGECQCHLQRFILEPDAGIISWCSGMIKSPA